MTVYKQTHKGIAALMVVVIIGSAALIMALSSSTRGLNTLELSVLQSITTHVRLSAESCAEESLLQLMRDSYWAGDTLSVGSISCTMVVNGNDDTRTILITTQQESGASQTLSVDVVREQNKWRVTRWNE